MNILIVIDPKEAKIMNPASIATAKMKRIRKILITFKVDWIADNFDIAKNGSKIIKLAEKVAKKRQAKFKQR